MISLFKKKKKEIDYKSKYNKLKSDYYELERRLSEELPKDEIKICVCGGYLFRVGTTIIHLPRINCDLSDGLSVDITTIDENLQNALKTKFNSLKDLTKIQGH